MILGMILITHDETNLRAIEGQVQDDSKNKDITEEYDENVNIFQLLLTLFMTFYSVQHSPSSCRTFLG